MKIDSKGNLWVATWGGVFILKYKEANYETFFKRYNQTNIRGIDLQANMIALVHEDKVHKGLYWLGTYLGGLYKMHYRSKRFMTNHLMAVNIPKPVSNSVRFLIKDTPNLIWVGTNTELILYDRKKETYKVYKEIQVIGGEKKPIYFPKIRFMYKDSKSQIWLGAYEGLYKLLKTPNGQLTAKRFHFVNKEEAIHTIYEADNCLYLGTWKGVGYLNLKTEKLHPTTFKIDTINNQKYGYKICKILKDKSNNY